MTAPLLPAQRWTVYAVALMGIAVTAIHMAQYVAYLMLSKDEKACHDEAKCYGGTLCQCPDPDNSTYVNLKCEIDGLVSIIHTACLPEHLPGHIKLCDSPCPYPPSLEG